MTRERDEFVAGYHAVHLPEDPARAGVWRAIADYLAPWVPPTAHVLELGAGYCTWINAVHAARKVAVDQWPQVARHAGSDVRVVVMDVSEGLRSSALGQFDVVLASNFLEHFEPATASAIVGDVSALLNDGGRFIVIQPNFRFAFRRYFDDYTHRSIFTDVSLSNLIRSHGLQIEICRPRFLPYSMRDRRWPAAEWAVRAYLRSPIKPGAGQMLVIARKAH
jgi:cyclopropane fatty-acyl-phospholipid synthase-like methyltransferase